MPVNCSYKPCQKPLKHLVKSPEGCSAYHSECWRLKLLDDYNQAVLDGNERKAAVIKEMGQRMKQNDLESGN